MVLSDADSFKREISIFKPPIRSIESRKRYEEKSKLAFIIEHVLIGIRWIGRVLALTP